MAGCTLYPGWLTIQPMVYNPTLTYIHTFLQLSYISARCIIFILTPLYFGHSVCQMYLFILTPLYFDTQMHHIYFNPTIFWTLRHIIFYFNPTTFWTLCSPPSLTTSSAFIRANTHWCHCRPACNHNTQADAGHSSSMG